MSELNTSTAPSLQASHELLVQQLYRLLRIGSMHDAKNQAVQRSMEIALPALRQLISAHDGELKILFAGAHIFIGGHPLKATRHVYEQARELAALFARLGYNELTLRDGLQLEELTAFVERVSRAQQQNKQLFHPPHGAIEIRQLDTTLLVGLDDDTLTPQERVIRTCTTTLVVMDRLYERMRHGDYSLVRHVKRIARDLVILAEDHPGTLLSFVASASNRSDAAMLAVKGAILSILTAKRLTRDLRNLADLSMTALLYDSGTVRACGLLRHAERRGLEFMPKLSEDAADRLPEATATMMSLFGRLNEASLSRGVYSYESHYIRRKATRGFPYQGKLAPTIEALVLAMVRRYLELVSLDLQRDDYQHGPDQALELLTAESTSKLEQIILQLFLISIGLYRPGTIVSLTSGARGVVSSNHKRPAQFTRPKLLLVYTAQGQRLSPPQELDLSAPTPEIVALGKIDAPLRSDDEALKAASVMIKTKRQIPLSDPAISAARFSLKEDPRFLSGLSEASESSASFDAPAPAPSISQLERSAKRVMQPIPTPVEPAQQPQQPPQQPQPAKPIKADTSVIRHNPALMSFGATPIASLDPHQLQQEEEDLPELPVYPISETIESHELGDSPSFAQEVLTSAPKHPQRAPSTPIEDEDADSTQEMELDQTDSSTSMLDHTGRAYPTDRIEVINIGSLAHLFPASFSELDEPGVQPQPSAAPSENEDDDLITSISASTSISSPQTWDSSLDNLPPSIERSELGVLSPDAYDEDEPADTFEATTLLPRSVIATFQFHDKHHDPFTDSETEAAPAPDKD